jgi:arylsulfatase A-like enzyme
LRQRGLLKNTIIILTADHGEAFWEKGWKEGDLIFGHCGPLITSVQKVPLIVYLPDGPRGKVIQENVQHIDIAPTILEYAHIDPARTTFMGDNLKSLIDGNPGAFGERTIYLENINDRKVDNTFKAVIKGEYKLVQWRKNRWAIPEYKLFNLDYNQEQYVLK